MSVSSSSTSELVHAISDVKHTKAIKRDCACALVCMSVSMYVCLTGRHIVYSSVDQAVLSIFFPHALAIAMRTKTSIV